MKPESIVFGISGAVFGLIVGWIIGTQQGPAGSAATAAAPAPAAAAAPSTMGTATRPALDETQAQTLRTIAERDANNVPSRIQLGNLYFDAERYPEAIKWYQEALKLDPKNVDVSTDLAVSFYYTDQPDRALTQFDYSLGIDPKHVKTLLNQGIVRAFGKQDLQGAMASWEQVLKIAPGSAEAQAAQRSLDNLKAAHPGGTPTPPPGTPPAGSPNPNPGRVGG